MKLIVFGATGVLGSRLVAEAGRRGHEVTAVARDPSRFTGPDAVRATAGDATNAESVAALATGHEAALSAVTQHEHPEMLVAAARALLDGLARAGVRRLVVAGGAGSLMVGSGQRLMDTPEFHDEWKPEAQAQADALAVYQQSDNEVEWSYVSPGALLEPGERTGAYRIGDDQLLSDDHGRSRITMEDFAIAMLDEVEHPAHPRRRFTAAH
ncbi:MAG: NAD(P)H-binding protein [Solirubrobacteraceae bacterium]